MRRTRRGNAIAYRLSDPAIVRTAAASAGGREAAAQAPGYAELATISIWADTVPVDPGMDTTELRSSGMAATQSRQLVLQVLHGSCAPVSAADVFAELRTTHARIALATVYRVLRLFERRGLVHAFMGAPTTPPPLLARDPRRSQRSAGRAY